MSQNAPFSITPILITLYAIMAVLGAIVAALVVSVGLRGYVGIFLVCLLPLLAMHPIRVFLVDQMSKRVGINASAPPSMPLPMRLGVIVLVSAVMALLFSFGASMVPLGILSGAFGALGCAIVMTLAYTVSTSFK